MRLNIILFIVFSLLASCKEIIEENGPSVEVSFIIKNETSKTVEVNLYHRDNSLFLSRNINIADSIVLDSGFIHPAPDGPTYSLTTSLDSAEIIFSDGKKLVQTFYGRGNNDTINNILSQSFYTSQKLSETSFINTFTLTEQDYLRAK